MIQNLFFNVELCVFLLNTQKDTFKKGKDKRKLKFYVIFCQKIEDDLEKDSASQGQLPQKRHTTHDTQTESDADDAESVLSAPVTREEFDHLEEREKVLGKAEGRCSFLPWK